LIKTNVIKIIERYYPWLVTAANSLQSPFLLLVRLYWGWQFMQTGWGKVNNIQKVTDFFTTLGIPAPALNAHFIAGLELVGGILLVVGLASRLIGFMLSANMLVAYITADREALFSIISDPDKFYAASPYTFLIASLIILAFGAGKISLDAWIESRYRAPIGSMARDSVPAL
jgi:putative oxidoreductase